MSVRLGTTTAVECDIVMSDSLVFPQWRRRNGRRRTTRVCGGGSTAAVELMASRKGVSRPKYNAAREDASLAVMAPAVLYSTVHSIHLPPRRR